MELPNKGMIVCPSMKVFYHGDSSYWPVFENREVFVRFLNENTGRPQDAVDLRQKMEADSIEADAKYVDGLIELKLKDRITVIYFGNDGAFTIQKEFPN